LEKIESRPIRSVNWFVVLILLGVSSRRGMTSRLVDKKTRVGYRSRRIRGKFNKNKLTIDPRPLLSEHVGVGMACRTKGNKEWLACRD
jgi:hypothetical protein